jgi:catechol 2,3-dioxygenase-like lactoylglutathione lyase family enzyme
MAGMAVTSFTQWWGVVLDAPDPAALARFYSELLGWEVASQEEGWVTIAQPGTTSYIGFHSSPEYVAPTWPPADGKQQMMMHLDVGVGEVEAAVAEALALGATLAEFQPQDDVRVMLDPIGHPFCLYHDS